MKLEIEVSDKNAVAIKAAMARVNIPESAFGDVAAPWVESLGEHVELENITHGYVYPNLKEASKAVDVMGADIPFAKEIEVTYRNNRGEVGTYDFRNPHLAKYEAERLNAAPLPATKRELQGKVDAFRVGLTLAIEYMSLTELREWSERIESLSGAEIRARARELEGQSGRVRRIEEAGIMRAATKTQKAAAKPSDRKMR